MKGRGRRREGIGRGGGRGIGSGTAQSGPARVFTHERCVRFLHARPTLQPPKQLTTWTRQKKGPNTVAGG
jgi:hypothetical protein